MAVETISGRYDLIRRLGQGGMGDVWLADDTLLGRPVAIKFVNERQLRETPGAARMLQDEARTAGRLLGHPQIVAVLDMLEVDGALHRGPAVVMEYVDGCNLAEWIAVQRSRFDEHTWVQLSQFIALEVTEAIHDAHKLGILHRDIKPQNILCSNTGRIKVADFGLARVVEAITRTHTVWGHHTPLYAAPEQWNDEKPDEGTDKYQLAATLYHLFAGEPANQGSSIIGLARWHEHGTLTPLKELVPSLPPAVASAVESGLGKDRAKRGNLWRTFDSISTAIMKPVKLRVNASHCSMEQINTIHRLTDIGVGSLKEKNDVTITFPNRLEALREAIAVTLTGGICSVVESSKSSGTTVKSVTPPQ